MIEKTIEPADMPQLFAEYLTQTDATFVFSSDIAADTWSDWVVSHADESGVAAVALERFIAWDSFKSKHLCTALDGRTACMYRSSDNGLCSPLLFAFANRLEGRRMRGLHVCIVKVIMDRAVRSCLHSQTG